MTSMSVLLIEHNYYSSHLYHRAMKTFPKITGDTLCEAERGSCARISETNDGGQQNCEKVTKTNYQYQATNQHLSTLLKRQFANHGAN